MRNRPADLVFYNGTVFTGDLKRPWADSVAIEEGRIVERESAREVIDLQGKFLCPGFIDAHVHPVTGGLQLLRCNLARCDNARCALDEVAKYAARYPQRPWLFGGGWWLEWFEAGIPSAAMLDGVVSDRPVFLYNRDGHSAWVNTAAIRLAGIESSTPDPPDGRIERYPDGSPQGTLHEGAMSLVERVMPEVADKEWEEAAVAGEDFLQAHGITGWQDADVRPQHHRAYTALAGRGQLRADVVAALWWDRHQGLEQIETLLAMRAGSVPGYRATTVKLMLDGIAENHTAAMLDPYLLVGGSGLDFIPRHQLIEIVGALDRLGFQCHFHAIGDRAVRHALDAMAASRSANGGLHQRHHISHLQVVHPDDVPRFGELEVIANLQAFWACQDPQMIELTLPFLGDQRAGWQYPFRSLRRGGARLAMGSDWPVSTPDVMKQLEVAVTGVYPEKRSSPPLNPGERLTLLEAITGFTSGSSYVNHRENQMGTIAPGYQADLVVLDRNPLEAEPVGDTQVEMTIIKGEVVYERQRR